jgi:hypothetical protein
MRSLNYVVWALGIYWGIYGLIVGYVRDSHFTLGISAGLLLYLLLWTGQVLVSNHPPCKCSSSQLPN